MRVTAKWKAKSENGMLCDIHQGHSCISAYTYAELNFIREQLNSADVGCAAILAVLRVDEV